MFSFGSKATVRQRQEVADSVGSVLGLELRARKFAEMPNSLVDPLAQGAARLSSASSSEIAG
jgi:hypothetical protein